MGLPPSYRVRVVCAALAAAFGAVLPAAPAASAQQEFTAWLGSLRQEALGRGIPADVLDAAFRNVQPLPKVIELDRKQPERTMTFDRYLARIVTPDRIARGHKLYRENRDLLERIAREHGVQPRFLLALWGIETDFGRNTGGFRVVDALATLAYDGRRAAYFRDELFDALAILGQRHIAPTSMTGSWAGAMGQCQFMPSTFVRHAIDGDGDGRRDIWNSLPDVLASAANYLRSLDWKGDQTWGREVRLPAGFDPAFGGVENRRPLEAWSAMGVRRVDGGALPAADRRAALILPDGAEGRAFLVYDNFRALLHWNRSPFFATTVGIFADRIGEAASVR